MSKCLFWIHEFRGGGLWLSIRRNFEIIGPKCQNVQYGFMNLEGGASGLAIRENLEIIGPKCQNVQIVSIFLNNLNFF